VNLGKAIDRYGVEAVTGFRIISVRLFRDINTANNIINAWESRRQSENWAEWTFNNQEAHEILERARLDYDKSH